MEEDVRYAARECVTPPLVAHDDDDQSADKFCETRWMAHTGDEKWLVVDGPRWRGTDLALPFDALDDSGRQDQGW